MRHRSGSSDGRGLARIGRLVVLLALSLLAFAAMTIASALTVRAADTVSLSILVPKPQSNTAEGPVGTNVTISAQGAVAGHDYQLSYALGKLSCTAGGNLGGAIRADASGKFTTTFDWPDGASAVGSIYVICYKDKSALSLAQASDQNFKVDSASHPSITLAQAPTTPTPGADNSPGAFYAGGPVQISGKNYYSNHTPLLAFYTLNQNFAPGDLQPGNALKQPGDGTAFFADANGAFTVTVTLPSITGPFYLHVVSNDDTGKYLPALIATQPITITQQPTPTPTVGVTVTPTQPGVTPTPGGSSGAGGNTAGIIGVFSLGGLSILLFILGVYLLTSTGASSRNF
jgi:hypothetical protein